MAFHVFLFLLVFFLLLSLALLWRLSWFHLQPSHSQAAKRRTLDQRLLKPRSPDDCPACRLASTRSLGAEPVPAPMRPWCEMKSHRGAPKRVNTEGFAKPRERGGKRLAQRYRQRTPAMAAGKTNRRWTAGEVLCYPLPPQPSLAC
jgi:hypothetical protein